MRKPEKSPKKRKAAIKRANKRSNRLKESRKVVAKKREEAIIERKDNKRKRLEAIDAMLKARFNQGSL